MVCVTSWIEISDERLRENYRALVATAGAGTAGAGTAVLGVVKANAYGHGLARCARVLAEAGAGWLGVTGVEEGLTVRAALAQTAEQPRVLVMCGLCEQDAEAMVQAELTPVVWSVEQIGWLEAAAVRLGCAQAVRVHMEIDSGMTRQGVRPGAELAGVLAALRESGRVRLEGLMTHFASAEVAGSRQTAGQRRQFEAALAQVRAAGFVPEWIHAGNTSAVDVGEVEGKGQTTELDAVAWVRRVAEGAKTLVRPGLALYGYCLPVEMEGVQAVSRLQGKVKPVMTWKAKVIGLTEVGVGDAVGYNGTYVAERPLRVALLGVGYADGLRRELSRSNARAGGWVMVQGKRAPMVGRISMNLTSVDVTGIAGVRLGDEVVVLGDGVTAEDHAGLAGTIAYEILCGVRAVEQVG